MPPAACVCGGLPRDTPGEESVIIRVKKRIVLSPEDHQSCPARGEARRSAARRNRGLAAAPPSSAPRSSASCLVTFQKLFPEGRSDSLPLRPRARRRSDLNHSSWPTQSLNPISYTPRLLNSDPGLEVVYSGTFWLAALGVLRGGVMVCMCPRPWLLFLGVLILYRDGAGGFDSF